MSLDEYLKSTDQSVTAFAAALGKPVSTVHGWIKGRRTPRLADALDVETLTGAQVSVKDLLPPRCAGRAT